MPIEPPRAGAQLGRSAVEQQLAALNASRFDVRIGKGAGSQFLAHLTPQEVVSRLPELAHHHSRGLSVAVRPSSGSGAHFVGWTDSGQLARATAAGFEPATVVQDGKRFAVWVQHAPAATDIRPLLGRAAELAYAQSPGRSTQRAFGPLAGIGPDVQLVSAQGSAYSRADRLAADLTAARAERLTSLRARLSAAGVPRLELFSSVVGGPGKAADLAWAQLALSRGAAHADVLAVLAQQGAHRLSSPVNQLSYATRTLAAALGTSPTSPQLLQNAAAAVAVPLKLAMAAVKVVEVGIKLSR